MSPPPDPKTNPTRTINQNPDAMPHLPKAIPLGLQHIMAMFAGNVTPPIIIAGVIGASPAEQIFLIQVALFVAGVSTLVQTIGIGPIGARLPIVQGTSFGFLPVALPLAKAFGLPAVLGASFVAGLLQILLGAFLKNIRHWFSTVVTGIVRTADRYYADAGGANYAAGGVGADDFASPSNLLLALFVLSVTIAGRQCGKGFIKASSILFGLVAGYLVAIALGKVDFTSLTSAAWFALPKPLEYGMTFSGTAILGMTLIMFVVGLETIGNISAITTGGAGRPAKDSELSGGVMADGVATSFAAIFNTLPNTAYAQNVGLITLTGVVSRHVVTIGGLLLIAMGLFPKLGGLVAAMPHAVLGGAGVVMFGMIASAGLKIIKECELDQRNMLIIAVSLSLGIGLPAVEAISETMPGQLGLLLKSGLVPAALAALLLDAILPGKPDRKEKLAKGQAASQTQP
ncbi:uracil-xanthine permease family protein [Vreelandella lionensis]|uniref:uracil-xanthine permease family protein n=1 Tax=Vreelandella lionensis TaxID=1144478 RepID=UPI0009F6B7DE|nr:nucleobase:cation symporter-2 family protein [Halomonas lionensis]